MDYALRADKTAITIKADVHNLIVIVFFTMNYWFLYFVRFISLIIFCRFFAVWLLLSCFCTRFWFLYLLAWMIESWGSNAVLFVRKFPILCGLSLLRLIIISRPSYLFLLSCNRKLIGLINNIIIQISAGFTTWTWNTIYIHFAKFWSAFDTKFMIALKY